MTQDITASQHAALAELASAASDLILEHADLWRLAQQPRWRVTLQLLYARGLVDVGEGTVRITPLGRQIIAEGRRA
jgi:hypothetical protein